MDASAKKIFWVQSIKAALFSLVFACIGVLLLGLLAKLFTLPENVLPIVKSIFAKRWSPPLSIGRCPPCCSVFWAAGTSGR